MDEKLIKIIIKKKSSRVIEKDILLSNYIYIVTVLKKEKKFKSMKEKKLEKLT